MTGRELAAHLGPLLGIGARDRLRALVTGGVNDIALRYDECNDVNAVLGLCTTYVDELQLYDGEESFIIELGTGEG